MCDYLVMLRAFTLLILLVSATFSGVVRSADITPLELEAFMDGVWESQSESHRAVGGVVTVVTADQVQLNKGYGYKNVETRETVDPERTMFRIASVSKPFTWLAVMQLVEQGKLDLNADVNGYIEAFQIPATFPEPITMLHLMSHTAGFEDVVLNLGRRDASELQPLGEYLKDNLPLRVRSPGVHSAYSNHSTAIAAHVVEQISGLDWFTYIEQNILAPLALEHTSARHPMSDQHREQFAQAYTWKGGEWHAQEFLHWMIYPAGMMSASGGDMARYMQTYLNEGKGVLEAPTFAQMLTPLHRPVPGGAAWLHGLYERSRNGIQIYGHGGDLNGFHSTMMILPDHNLALFASFNTEPAAAIRSNLANAFVDHFFPKTPPLRAAPDPEAAESQKPYHGSYGRLRRNFSDFSKLALLLDSVTVDSNQDGYLTVTTQSGPRQYVRLEGDRFGARYSAGEILFIRDAAGQVTHIESASFPAGAMDRLAPLDDPKLHQKLFGLVALIAVVYLVYWPIRFLRRRYYHVTNPLGFSLVHYGLAWTLAALTLYTIGKLVEGLGDVEQFYFGMPKPIETLLLVLTISCGLLVVNAVWTALLVFRGIGSLSERINFAIFALSGLLYVWLNAYWNTLSYYL